MRLLSGHILPSNASNFTCSHLDLKNFQLGRNPGHLLTGAGNGKRGDGKGLKGPPTSKREGRKRQEKGEEGESRGKEGPAAGDLAARS